MRKVAADARAVGQVWLVSLEKILQNFATIAMMFGGRALSSLMDRPSIPEEELFIPLREADISIGDRGGKVSSG